MRFRFYSTDFEKSMKSVKNVKNLKELEAVLFSRYGRFDKIEFEYYGLDARNGWDTYWVIGDGLRVGASDGKFDKPLHIRKP